MIRIASSDEVYLDKEITVSMTVGDLSVLYALICVTSNSETRDYIAGKRGIVFSDEALVQEITAEADMQQMYQDVHQILQREGVVI